MKKILGVLLILCTLLPLCACSSGLETQPLESAPPAAEKTQEKKDPTYSVPTPLTWKEIDAIPIANGDMTSDELRKICVDYFHLQTSFQWTPNKIFEYTIRSSGSVRKFQPGKCYGGIPYVTSSKGGGNLPSDTGGNAIICTSLSLEKAIIPATLGRFANKDSVKIQILCRISTGEEPLIYEGNLVK